MIDEKWQKVKEIFDSALRREPEERRKFVREVCGNDETLLAEVESLLASLGSAESFLETPAVAIVADLVEAETKKLEHGRCFGHYEIIRQIGAGGMGEVYLAQDKKLDRRVAIKILNEKFSRDESNLHRFIREAKTASGLNHPNILVIHEIGESEGAHYIVSEHIKGVTLREIFNEKTLKLSEVLDIAIQTAGALCAAHEARLIHRDIKPENIMIRPDGFVKILDFGLAKLVEQKNKSILGLEDETAKQNQTAKGVILGTVNYMSPEQAKGERVDERTDIFSFGVVIYEMIAGKTPFAGDSVSETLANLINREPQPLVRFAPNVPNELQRIVSKTLRKNKEARYQTMRDVLTDLRELKEAIAFDEKLERSASPNENATAVLQATTAGAKQQTAETLHGISRQIKRHTPFVALTLIFLVVGFAGFGYWFSSVKKTTVNDKKSIAVLPLNPINAGVRDEIYEFGIADSLIYRLNSMKGFIVRPLSATRKYADVAQDPLAAGREQQVDYILASNYQIAGGKIRVTAQLLNVETGQIEETYKSEKDAGDIFAMQDAVSEDVGKLFQTHFALPASSPASAARRGTDNEEAYRLYLQGMYLVEKENLTDAKRAIEIFDEALAIDPKYAKAWAGEARAHCLFAHVGGNSPDAEFAIAKPALERAFALDANLPEAHAVLGIIKTDYDWNFAEAEKHFLRAIETAPNPDIFHRWYAGRLSAQGRSEDAIARIKTAIDINPNSIVHQIVYGRILYFARRYDDASTQLQRVIEMDSASPAVYNFLWLSYHMKGDYPRAYESFMRFQQLIGAKDEVLKKYETSYAKNGWQGVLLRYLEISKANDAKGSNAYTIAVVSALLGQREQSLRYLDDAVKNRSLQIPSINGDPSFDSLRDDPRFAELVRRVESKRSQPPGVMK
ncbi:MAG: protein kinase [Pyrinomonadaceae bacterium]